MNDGRYADAREVLERTIREMASDWRPARDNGTTLTVSSWDVDEFTAYTQLKRRDASVSEKVILWIDDSYSKALCHLSAIALHEEKFQDALFCVEHALLIEPDHPLLWSQKGLVLNRMKRHAEALACYRQAETIRAWAPVTHVARALRGQGAVLIDLQRLDEAESAFQKSLELDPLSDVARRELEYLADVRKQQLARKNTAPWFVHAFVNQPEDPLTRELVALVEDLEPIPGPKTIGPDNYTQILSAFMERGWAGFEEAFDLIVARTRPDYKEIKRDLLCESVFNRKAHRRLTEAYAGRKSVEQVIEEARSNRKPRPQ